MSLKHGVEISKFSGRTIFYRYAPIAQKAEYMTFNLGVLGSNPSGRTKKNIVMVEKELKPVALKSKEKVLQTLEIIGFLWICRTLLFLEIVGFEPMPQSFI